MGGETEERETKIFFKSTTDGKNKKNNLKGSSYQTFARTVLFSVKAPLCVAEIGGRACYLC